jgi:dCMP deaminase
MNWDSYFYKITQVIAQKSKDPTTAVGALAVGADHQILSTGYNGIPRRVRDDEKRLVRPEKYKWVVHAEANCVAHAARTGVGLKESRLYCTHHPCASCAALIIQSGIVEVVMGTGQTSMPKEEFDIAETLFREAGISLRRYIPEVVSDQGDKENTGEGS